MHELNHLLVLLLHALDGLLNNLLDGCLGCLQLLVLLQELRDPRGGFVRVGGGYCGGAVEYAREVKVSPLWLFLALYTT